MGPCTPKRTYIHTYPTSHCGRHGMVSPMLFSVKNWKMYQSNPHQVNKQICECSFSSRLFFHLWRLTYPMYVILSCTLRTGCTNFHSNSRSSILLHPPASMISLGHLKPPKIKHSTRNCILSCKSSGLHSFSKRPNLLNIH